MPKQKGAVPKRKLSRKPGKTLTPLKRRFIGEYMICCNATEAARRAGVGGDPARRGWDMLQEPVVQAAIERRQRELAAKYEVTQERIVAELARIGFADIRSIVRWGDGLAVEDPETGEVRIANGVALKSSDDLPEAVAAAIQQVAQGQNGLRVKLHSKLDALEKLGKYLGMFKQQVEIGGADGQPLPPFEFHLHPPKA